ncbi:MAG: prepilin-type N-terminal cleavage/methylation domain-containing protein [Candidatus Woesebacteria bacterium]|jgi:prepilin-type N-terminal cleavage/methylation domain-containing protein
MTAFKKGFTLIELLVVIAVLGVLAVVVLVAINPVQQLAKGRDTGRKSTVKQIGNSLQAYYTRTGSYLTSSNCDWVSGTHFLTCLVDEGEVGVEPDAIDYSAGSVSACTGGDDQQNNLCYDVAGTSLAVVYATLESDTEDQKCANPSTETPLFLWSSEDGRAGTICVSGSPPTWPSPGTFAGSWRD